MTSIHHPTSRVPLSKEYAVFYVLGHEEIDAISTEMLSSIGSNGGYSASKRVAAAVQGVVNAYDSREASRTLAKLLEKIVSGVHPPLRNATKGTLETFFLTKLDDMWEKQKKLEIPEPTLAERAFVLFADLSAHGLVSHDALHREVDKALDSATSPEFMVTVVRSLMFRSTTGIGAQALSYEVWTKATAKMNGMDLGDGGELARFVEQCQRGRVSYYDLNFADGHGETRAEVTNICDRLRKEVVRGARNSPVTPR